MRIGFENSTLHQRIGAIGEDHAQGHAAVLGQHGKSRFRLVLLRISEQSEIDQTDSRHVGIVQNYSHLSVNVVDQHLPLARR